MRLAINAGSDFKGGALQVALSFIHECRNFKQHEYYVFATPNLMNQIRQNEFPENFRFYTMKKRTASNIFFFIRMMIWYKRMENRIKPDCVISTGGHGYWKPKAPLVGGYNIPHFIYPESPYFKSISTKKRLYWRRLKKIQFYFYNRLDAIFVQTDDVNERLAKLISPGIPIYTVTNTVNHVFLEKDIFQNKLPTKKEGEFRLLTISSYYSHKNIEIINSVLEELEILGYFGISFVVTLPQTIYETIFIRSLRDKIYNVGPVPIRECPSLYRECDFMFLPTLLECFSASYAEAMEMRKPILTSDLSFARTVCEKAAIYFDPVDSKDIASKIIEIVENQNLQEEILRSATQVKEKFSTAYTRAENFLSICEKTWANKKH